MHTEISAALHERSGELTLIQMLQENALKHPDDVALRHKDRGIWQQVTWRQWFEETLAFAAGVSDLGLAVGDKVLVLSDNRPRPYSGLVAASAVGAYPMPAYPDAAPEEVAHFLDAEPVKFGIASDQEQVDKMLELRERGAQIDFIVYDDPRGLRDYEQSGLLLWDQIVAEGRRLLKDRPGLERDIVGRSGPDDAAVLLHSSGTTGKPKGIILTHRNIHASVLNAHRGGVFGVNESVLAYLPLAWIGDFSITLAAGIILRFQINIPESQETVAQNLREVAPTFYMAAPRSWDNMLSTIQVRMEDSTWLKRRLYDYFMNLALAVERAKIKGDAVPLHSRFLRSLGETVIFGPIKDQLGLSRVKSAFTGGEAIGEDTFLFYRALGVQLRQVYGQTESCALVTSQAPDEFRLHTVGKPLPGVEVSISDEGEILVRSDSVFPGYYERPDATAEAFQDGWLRTGDAGFLEEDGHLVVLGRLSEIVYTADGERYIPNYIENRLKFSPYIKDAAVFGRGRETLGTLICIDWETVGHWAETKGISYTSYADLSQNDQVIALVNEALERVNAVLPDALKIRHFVCLHKQFDPDDGEITRTRKLRRKVIEERYAALIEAVYAGELTAEVEVPVVYDTGEIGRSARHLTIQRI